MQPRGAVSWSDLSVTASPAQCIISMTVMIDGQARASHAGFFPDVDVRVAGHTLHAAIPEEDPMKKLLNVMLALLSSLLIGSCSPVQDAQEDKLGPSYEARAWLQANPNPFALASNRFASTEEALVFVDLLYARGAIEVLVAGIRNEEWRLELEGGPYADTLIIRLPPDPALRSALFELANEEIRREGFSRERDTGQEELMLWWD